MSDVKVSIIIPVYNTEKYLRKCLNSVVKQTLSEIQIICINDGSTDKSLEILQRYASRWKNIEIIDQENQGAGIARNNAYPYIKGKYTCFVDSDDSISKEYCEVLYNKAEETSSEIVYLHTQPLDGYLLNCAPWKKLVLSKFMLDNQIYFSKFSPHEDVLFVFKCYVLQTNYALIINDNQNPLYLHVSMRPGSYGSFKDERQMSNLKVLKETEQWLKDCGKYEEYKSQWTFRKLRNINYVLSKLPQKDQTDYLKQATTLFE